MKIYHNNIKFYEKVFNRHIDNLVRLGFTSLEIEQELKKQATYQLEGLENYRKKKKITAPLTKEQTEYCNWLRKIQEKGRIPNAI